MKVIILAAGMGSRLGTLTNDKPKCMLKLFNETLVERQIKIFHSCNINDITIVTGYMSEEIDIPDVNYVKNKNYETTNINESLFCALEPSNSPVLVTYGDIVFERKIIQQMLEFTDGIGLDVNLNWKKYYQNRNMHPLSEAENVLVENGRILQIRKNISESLQNQQIGEFLGIMMLSSDHVKILLERYSYLKKNHVGAFHNSSSLSNAYITDMLQEMINCGATVKPVFTEGKWCEIDTPEDLKNAEKSINKFQS
uniref:Sugar nucleotidyltransferase-like protein n=1 Tax=uncultured marine thaumarchaeote KM3_82_A11 TaxID=1456301 RepID=A0A075HUM2_9ARCH|nr:sugar nucleotidyltransferase-like protein [uncultured marine thaumarchaeote KM3_82_A11]